MRLLPVVGRELRAIARRPRAYWVRSVAALAAFLAIGYVGLMGARGFGALGRDLFEILSMIAFAYCALAGVRGTADALSAEKREGTLGLLFLTDLKGHDVTLGKFASLSITSFYGILATVPVLALVFMSGGTSPQQFFMMCACLVNTLFFSLAVGIVVSTFAQHERPAMGMTLAIIFVSLVMPYAVAAAHTYDGLEIWEVMLPEFLVTSPFFAFRTANDPGLYRIYFDDFCLSLAYTHLAAWLCLIVAGASVAQQAHADAPSGKLITWFQRLRQEWAYGKAARRRAIRGALLDRNAFSWLAARDRLKQRYAWIFLGLLAALWMLGRWKAPEVVEEWPITLFSLWFAHWFFKMWVASEVAARFIEDRRSNALELLLTTPLKVKEFARGQMLALARQFGPAIAAIVLLDLLAGWKARDSSAYLIRTRAPFEFFAAGLLHLAFDLCAIVWVAMWRSLHLRGTNRAIIQTMFLVVWLPVLGWFFLWQGSWAMAAMSGSANPSSGGVLWKWTIGCLLYDLVLIFFARSAFLRDFREAATQAFDKPTPLRWKFWKRRASKTHAVIKVSPQLRRARRLAVAAAVLVIVGYATLAWRRDRLEKEVDARIAEVRQSGAPLTQNELAQWRVYPRASESGSELLRLAAKTPDALKMPRFRQGEMHWHSKEKLSGPARSNIIAWVSKNAELFQKLDQLPQRKPGGPVVSGRYQLLTTVDLATDALQLKARVEMENDPAAAGHTIELLLHVIRMLEGEPFGTFGGPRRTYLAATELLERAAVQGGFRADDWRRWKEIIAQLDPVVAFRDNLAFERVEGFAVFQWPVDHLYQRFGRQYILFPSLFNINWSIRKFTGEDQAEIVEYLDYMAGSIAAANKPYWQVAPQSPREKWRRPNLNRFIAPQLLPAFEWLFAGATANLAQKRILMTVADVEIYRAEHGALPPELRAVNGELPLDPFDGKPLRYVTRPGGYSIYSVGENMQDDGGAPAVNSHFGDFGFHCGEPPDLKGVRRKR